MIWIIATVIAVIAIFVLTGYVIDDRKWKFNPKQLLAVFGLLLLIPGCFTKVPANSVGIKYSAFTGTSENTIPEGIHTKNIFDTIYNISTEVQTVSVMGMTSQTKDAQYVTSQLDVKYRVNPANAFVVFKQFRTLKNLSEQMISPTVQRVLELVTVKYNVIDILGEERGGVYQELEKNLAEEFDKYGIQFCAVSIVDMDAGDAIENAITAEAVAKKAVETAEQELRKTQTEAKQKSVQAQADQDAAKISAETRIIQAEAEKKSNELINQSLTKELLEKQWITKWNGVVPIYYGGSEPGLLMNIGE